MAYERDECMQSLFHIFREARGDHKAQFIPWYSLTVPERSAFVDWIRDQLTEDFLARVATAQEDI